MFVARGEGVAESQERPRLDIGRHPRGLEGLFESGPRLTLVARGGVKVGHLQAHLAEVDRGGRLALEPLVKLDRALPSPAAAAISPRAR